MKESERRDVLSHSAQFGFEEEREAIEEVALCAHRRAAVGGVEDGPQHLRHQRTVTVGVRVTHERLKQIQHSKLEVHRLTTQLCTTQHTTGNR